MDVDKSDIPKDKEAPSEEEQLTLDALGVEKDSEPTENVDETVKSEENDFNANELNAEKIHSKKSDTKSKSKTKKPVNVQKTWQRNLGFVLGLVTLVALVLGGSLGQYYKGRIMPGVVVAGIESNAKTSDELEKQLSSLNKSLKLTIVAGEKKLEPQLEALGMKVDIESTLSSSFNAKRKNGLLDRLKFWETKNIPAVITINDTLLNQYIEASLPELTKPAQDSQLTFDAVQGKFIITEESNGSGPDITKLKEELITVGKTLNPASIDIEVSPVKPNITTKKLQPLLDQANLLTTRQVVLTGLGYVYRATPAEIASWITPTPQEDGSLKLVVDPAKIHSYVEGIGKKISSPPQDQKVLKDLNTGGEVVIQAGSNGTELSDKQVLTNAIAEALKNQQDISQTMNIQTASFKTVNMNAYDKWIEVDLSEQRTTAYEGATALRSFTIASGMKGYETVTGEFAIWLKNRKQTMTGGSKADGSYYSIPNVEWVSYFYKDYALHGAWWREKFGAPASHGCVNMTNADAKWLYEWAPVGTKVIVHH